MAEPDSVSLDACGILVTAVWVGGRRGIWGLSAGTFSQGRER